MQKELCKKCNREYDCEHQFDISGDGTPLRFSLSNCAKCGSGKDGDKCQGVCPDCRKDDLE